MKNEEWVYRPFFWRNTATIAFAGPVTFFSAIFHITISFRDRTANSLRSAAPRCITESSNMARGE